MFYDETWVILKTNYVSWKFNQKTVHLKIGIEHPVDSAQSAASGVQISSNLCNTCGVLFMFKIIKV